MINKEMLHRIKVAGEYQRKAIRALFPEEMGEHLDVIENELKMIVMELAADFLNECRQPDMGNGEQDYEQASKVKKVDIA